MYLCAGITRFAPMDAAAATLMDTVRRIDSDRIANMIDKLNGVFAASGVKTSVTEESVKAAVVTRHGVQQIRSTCRSARGASFQEALFALVRSLRAQTRCFLSSTPTLVPTWTR